MHFSKLSVLIILALAANMAFATTDCEFKVKRRTMTLKASCTTHETILVPDGMTLNGAGHTITAADPSGGHFLGAVVMNEGSIAHVTNLNILAGGLTGCGSSGPPDTRLRAILFNGASGSITGNQILAVNRGPSGCQEGNGIEVRNPPYDGTHPGTKNVTISGNMVTDYQKNGITANGDVFAKIRDNVVEGEEPITYIAQNGIQFGYGARGEARGNSVDNNWYTGANWAATGILVFETSGINVKQNTVRGAQSGIGVEAWCWLAPEASNNKVIGNTVVGADWGISVSAYSLGFGYSQCDAAADNNKVVHNVVAGPPGETGISVNTGAFWGGTGNPTADNNKIINNDISDFTTAIDNSGTKTKIHANTPSGP